MNTRNDYLNSAGAIFVLYLNVSVKPGKIR